MARTSRSIARVVMARERVAELDRGMMTGLEFLAMDIINAVRPPDATSGYMTTSAGTKLPRVSGEWLIANGCFISYIDGKRVGGDADKKPKDLRVGKGALVAVGFPFPGRFNELGTVHQPARPFLTPAVYDVVGNDAAVTNAMARGFVSFTARAIRSAIRGGVGRT